jgi:elongator complex protein 3
MPNLLGSSVEADIDDIGRVFADADFRPDELKIYPCSLIESAELMRFYERGEWRPYSHDELAEVVTTALAAVPRYCRVTRVIRDFSSDDIVAGNKLTNFRQIAEQALEERGGRCVDIRSREIRRDDFSVDRLKLRATDYDTGIGREQFLEFVDDDDRIVAFLRLSLPERGRRVEGLDELAGCAMIREVHVYGGSVAPGRRSDDEPQHSGLGQRLIEDAARRAREAGYPDLAVISAVGTRAYYRRQGFRDGDLYQHLATSHSLR